MESSVLDTSVMRSPMRFNNRIQVSTKADTADANVLTKPDVMIKITASK